MRCDLCSSKFHYKCCSANDKATLKSTNQWYCNNCNIFPFAQLTNNDLADLFDNLRSLNNKTKCFGCNKKIKKNVRFKECLLCTNPFHIQCSTKGTNDWTCPKCSLSELPFHHLNNDDFTLNFLNLSNQSSELIQNTPSFSIKTLLDSLPGENFSKDDFISNSISSKYYSPCDLIKDRLSKRDFSMIHLNIASLQLHIDELRCLLVAINNPFDVIAITETRLHEQNPIIDLSIPGYDFHHTETRTQNGGAALYIRNSFDYEILTNFSVSLENICESIFIEIKSKKQKNIIIGCIYRHHTPISLFCSEFMNKTLHKISKSKKTYALLGDFNINLLDYEKHPGVNDFYDTISSYGFRPLILQPTRVTKTSSTLIDNIFINDLVCNSKGGNLVTSISDHYAQFCSIDVFDKHHEKPSNKRSVRNWRIFNKREFQSELTNINWDNIITPQMNTNSSCQSFYNKITILLNEMAPYKKLTKKEISLKQKPWISPGILRSMQTRDKLYRDFLTQTDQELKDSTYKNYKKHRNMIISLTRKSKKKYYSDYFTEYNTNIKKTWEGIRQLININKKKSISIRYINHENLSTSDNKEMANAFNSFYANIGNSIENKIPNSQTNFTHYLNQPVTSTFTPTLCTDSEIKAIIADFGVNKSSGPNSIPTNLLKEFSSLFIPPIKTLVNKSLYEGTFPSIFKLALICPIYKKSDKTKCVNYRPISLLSNLSKIFERIMYNRLEGYLEHNKLIYDLQFGFRKKFSTDHALLSITEQIKNNFQNKNFSCGVFVDLEKAFDTVNHKILISKLKHYGFQDKTLSWLTSYLSNRTHKVTLNGEISDPKPVTCGVPQGSILGPLLFLIYINDMNKAIQNSQVYHFADDTNLLFSHKNEKTLKKIANKDLQNLYEWLCANRLSLNVAKTEFMIFRPPHKQLTNRVVLKLNRTKIFESTKIKYLGIILDSRLTWKEHINELSKKLNRSMGMLFKTRDFCPPSILKNLYHSIFNSHVNYGLPVWGYASDILLDKIIKAQKKAIRTITFSKYTEHVAPLLKKLNILNIKDQRYLKTASLLWDLKSSTLPQSLASHFTTANSTHSHHTRFAASGNLIVSTLNNTFKCIATTIFNDLNQNQAFTVSSKKVFLSNIKQDLISEYN